MDSQYLSRNGEAQFERHPSLFTRLVFRVFERVLSHIQQGNIRVILPSGKAKIFGSNQFDLTITVRIISVRTLWRSVARGSLGFAESYMRGEWETDDLDGLFRIFLHNSNILRGGKGIFRQRIIDKMCHRFRKNTRAGSRKNISQHYDLGNAFYHYWLDETMTYSSALFEQDALSLKQAQRVKFKNILNQLDLSPGQSLLEIGCGWGGFAKYTAEKTGAFVTGITLSEQQFSYANSQIKNFDLEHQCTFHLQDYRDVEGRYDRIVSIEMIEAVGKENWMQYFNILNDRLATNGTVVLQAVTISEDWYPDYYRRPDFIQRYIFPGGFLPTSQAIFEHASRAGFTVENPLNFGDSYARTLLQWRESFLRNWPQIRQLGFDNKFRRMWDYYLTYCAAGFEYGSIDVGIYRLTKKD